MKLLMLIFTLMVPALVHAQDMQTNQDNWRKLSEVDKMDGRKSVSFLAASEDKKVFMLVGCTAGSVRLAFTAADDMIKLGNVDCSKYGCNKQAYVRWKYDPSGILNTYWTDLSDNGHGVLFGSLWKKQLGMIADSKSVLVELQTVLNGTIQREINIAGFRPHVAELAEAGCNITFKEPKKK